jgi:hypothetical protein
LAENVLTFRFLNAGRSCKGRKPGQRVSAWTLQSARFA